MVTLNEVKPKSFSDRRWIAFIVPLLILIPTLVLWHERVTQEENPLKQTADVIFWSGRSLTPISILFLGILASIITGILICIVQFAYSAERRASELSSRLREEVILRTECEDRFKVMNDCSPLGVFVTDSDGEPTYMNAKCAQIADFTYDSDVVQRFINALHAEDRELLMQNWYDVVHNKKTFHASYRLVRPGGEVRWVSVNAAPIMKEETLNGYVGTIEDITDMRILQEELQHTSEFQNAMLNSANYSIISTDANGVILSFNGCAERWLGYSAGEMVGKCTPSKFLLFEEIVNRAAELSEELGITVNPGLDTFTSKADIGLTDEYDWTYVRKDGTCFPVWLSITALRNEKDEIRGYLGIAADISVRKLAEREQARLTAILDTTSDLVATFDISGSILYLNRAGRKMVGAADNQASADLDIYESLTEWSASMIRSVAFPAAAKSGEWEGESAIQRSDGTVLAVSQRIICHRMEDNTIDFYSTIARDISQRKLFEEKIEEQIANTNDAYTKLEQQKEELVSVNKRLTAMATTDGLTGLLNHRTFQEKLKICTSQAKQNNSTLSIVLLDVDKFKTYNDTCGHPAGDFVLKTVANILKANVRCTDFASRYGGEEFVFILENCDANSAVSIAKEVRHTIETLTWPTIQVTASFGVSTLNATISDEALMIREADIALYRSKRRGRNTVTHADEPADEFDLTNEEMRPYAELLKKMIEAENDTIQSASERVRETLIQVQDITVRSWTSLLDIRDKATLGHSARVTELTVKLAEQCGMNSDELRYVRWGAMLHDIGKIAVPDSILLKPGPLTEEEMAIMQEHTTIARDIMIQNEFMIPAAEIPYCHHEKWDGSGYPRGLKGDEIPLCARLFAVVDVWDALSYDRPYRGRWDSEKVENYILEQSGKHFDPRAVSSFLKMMIEQKMFEQQSYLAKAA